MEGSHQKYQQPANNPINLSQHQHSVSQPSSSHFNENTSQSESNRRQQIQQLQQQSNHDATKKGHNSVTINREHPLNCQNVGIYGKMAADTNSQDDFNSEDCTADEGLESNRLESNNTPESEKSAGGNSGEFNMKSPNLDGRFNGVDRQPFYAGVSPAHGRQLRNRMYGISKLGMIKHETKL